MRRRTMVVTLVGMLVGGLAACTTNSTGPAAVPLTALVSVTPAGGAAGVPSNVPIVVTLSHGMSSGMEVYVSLHEGDVTGPTVPCTAAWSSDRTMLTFTPAAPLSAATHYTLHVGGGMKDADGNPIDMTAHGMQIGGQWATDSMMTGSGMMGGGGPMSGHEMGPGWLGSNGMYGMVFSFTTA